MSDTTDWRRHALWIDGLAGAAMGLAFLLLLPRLVDWYELPRSVLLAMAAANLLYASYSLTLAVRARVTGRRPAVRWIRRLVVANALWGVVCLVLAVVFARTASPFGLAHLILEGLGVGAMAVLEWRWRAFFSAPAPVSAPAPPTPRSLETRP